MTYGILYRKIPQFKNQTIQNHGLKQVICIFYSGQVNRMIIKIKNDWQMITRYVYGKDVCVLTCRSNVLQLIVSAIISLVCILNH